MMCHHCEYYSEYDYPFSIPDGKFITGRCKKEGEMVNEEDLCCYGEERKLETERMIWYSVNMPPSISGDYEAVMLGDGYKYPDWVSYDAEEKTWKDMMTHQPITNVFMWGIFI